MIYGYVRVSTREQNEDRQMIAMQNFGVDKVYADKQSGKDLRVHNTKNVTQIKKRRYSCCQEHRPSGKKLR